VLLASLAKTDLLVLDEFGAQKLNDEHRQNLLEILKERYALRSTLMTAGVPPSNPRFTGKSEGDYFTGAPCFSVA
jgi:DNA replication protein DnaC